MIWKKDLECMQPAEMKKLQLDYLKKLIPYIYNNCPVYKKKIDDAGVKPDSIKSIDDIKRLPFTTKIDMRDNYPYGLFSKRTGLPRYISQAAQPAIPRLSVIPETI